MLKSTGERIRERRKAIGLSAEEVAPLVGKSAPTFYHYEKCGYDKIPLNIIDQLAPVLKTSVAYLMLMTDDPYPVEGDQTASDYVRIYGTRDPTKVVHNPRAPRLINSMRLDRKVKSHLDRLTAEDMRSLFDYVEFLASRHKEQPTRSPDELIKESTQTPNNG